MSAKSSVSATQLLGTPCKRTSLPPAMRKVQKESRKVVFWSGISTSRAQACQLWRKAHIMTWVKMHRLAQCIIRQTPRQSLRRRLVSIKLTTMSMRSDGCLAQRQICLQQLETVYSSVISDSTGRKSVRLKREATCTSSAFTSTLSMQTDLRLSLTK